MTTMNRIEAINAMLQGEIIIDGCGDFLKIAHNQVWMSKKPHPQLSWYKDWKSIEYIENCNTWLDDIEGYLVEVIKENKPATTESDSMKLSRIAELLMRINDKLDALK